MKLILKNSSLVFRTADTSDKELEISIEDGNLNNTGSISGADGTMTYTHGVIDVSNYHIGYIEVSVAGYSKTGYGKYTALYSLLDSNGVVIECSAAMDTIDSATIDMSQYISAEKMYIGLPHGYTSVSAIWKYSI